MKKLALVLLINFGLIAQITPTTPSGLTSQFIGSVNSATSTTYYYWVQAIYPTGRSTIAGPSAVTFSAVLTPNGNFIQVSWQASVSATAYDVMRTTSSTTPTGSCNCAILVNYNTNSFQDHGLSTQSYTVIPGGATSSGVQIGGDIGGTNSTPLVTGINGVAVSTLTGIPSFLSGVISNATATALALGTINQIVATNTFPITFSLANPLTGPSGYLIDTSANFNVESVTTGYLDATPITSVYTAKAYNAGVLSSSSTETWFNDNAAGSYYKPRLGSAGTIYEAGWSTLPTTGNCASATVTATTVTPANAPTLSDAGGPCVTTSGTNVLTSTGSISFANTSCTGTPTCTTAGFIVPKIAGLTYSTGTLGAIGYDTTNNNYHVYNGADQIIAVFATVPTNTGCVAAAVTSNRINMATTSTLPCPKTFSGLSGSPTIPEVAAIRSTGLTGAVTNGTTLCTSTATTCSNAGTYHVHFALYQSGSACSANTTNGVSPNLTWTDGNGTAHTNQGFPVFSDGVTTSVTGTMAWGATTVSGWGSADMNIDTNGSAITYGIAFTQCTTGTATYAASIVVTRLQ